MCASVCRVNAARARARVSVLATMSAGCLYFSVRQFHFVLHD